VTGAAGNAIFRDAVNIQLDFFEMTASIRYVMWKTLEQGE
jgi:hypothetical protein